MKIFLLFTIVSYFLLNCYYGNSASAIIFRRSLEKIQISFGKHLRNCRVPKQISETVHPMLITAFWYTESERHQEPCKKVGSLSPAEHLVGFEPDTFRFWLKHVSPLDLSQLLKIPWEHQQITLFRIRIVSLSKNSPPPTLYVLNSRQNIKLNAIPTRTEWKINTVFHIAGISVFSYK